MEPHPQNGKHLNCLAQLSSLLATLELRDEALGAPASLRESALRQPALFAGQSHGAAESRRVCNALMYHRVTIQLSIVRISSEHYTSRTLLS